MFENLPARFARRRVPVMIAAVLLSLAIFAFILFNIAPDVAEILFTVSIAVILLYFGVQFGMSRAARRRRRGAILQIIRTAIEMSLPLAPTIFAEANARRGKLRRSLLAVHRHLSAGEPLAVALSNAPEIPIRWLDQIASLDRAGILASHFKYVGPSVDRSEQQIANRFYRNYALFFTVLLLVLAPMLDIFAFTRLRFVLQRTTVPSSMTWVMQIEQIDGWLLLGLVIVLIAMWSRIGRWMSDAILWHIPLLGERARSRAFSRSFRFVAAAMLAGRPLDQAMADAASLADFAPLRWRFAGCATALSDGAGLATAARTAQFPGLVAGMLGAIPAGDSVIATMQFLADFYESKFSRLDDLAQSLFIPALVLVMGAATLVMGLSIFQSLALIEGYSGVRLWGAL